MDRKLSKEVKNYLIRELKDYKDNKKIIEELRMDIIEASPQISLGVPSSPNKGNESQTSKVYKLMTNIKINRLENICYHIEKILSELDGVKYDFYVRCFEKRHSKVKICMETNISEKTYYRYWNCIIYNLAEELGFL